MDACWSTLTFSMKLALCSALNQTAYSMNTQEIANVMYALSILSFDCDYSVSYELTSNPSSQQAPAAHTTEAFDSSMLLYYAHSKVLQAFKNLQIYGQNTDPDQLQVLVDTGEHSGDLIESSMDQSIQDNIATSSQAIRQQMHSNQFAIYFAFMQSQENTKCLALEVLGTMPKIQARSDLTFSNLQELVNHELHAQLSNLDSNYVLLDEFQGLDGIFPMDIAVFHHSKPVAFLEVDGISHYRKRDRTQGSCLKRTELLKEHLYRSRYEDVPVYRVSGAQVRRQGAATLMHELAAKIHCANSSKQ
jgi:hypothetical protein